MPRRSSSCRTHARPAQPRGPVGRRHDAELADIQRHTAVASPRGGLREVRRDGLAVGRRAPGRSEPGVRSRQPLRSLVREAERLVGLVSWPPGDRPRAARAPAARRRCSRPRRPPRPSDRDRPRAPGATTAESNLSQSAALMSGSLSNSKASSPRTPRNCVAMSRHSSANRSGRAVPSPIASSSWRLVTTTRDPAPPPPRRPPQPQQGAAFAHRTGSRTLEKPTEAIASSTFGPTCHPGCRRGGRTPRRG